MAKNKAKSADLKSALLATIVEEVRQQGTTGTEQAVKIGDLCLQYGTGKEDTAKIKERLTEEGFDTNITRQIKIACVVRICPDAAVLGVGVVACLAPLVSYPKGVPSMAKDHTRDQLETLVNDAVKKRWTAAETRTALAKFRKPDARKPKGNPKTLAAALKTIKKAKHETLVEALAADLALCDKIGPALASARNQKEKAA